MKRIKLLFFMALLIQFFLLWSALPSQADIFSYDKEPHLYGRLDQHDIPGGFTFYNLWDIDPNIGDVSCGPASAVNSFLYLENKYPNIYNGSLIPDTNKDWNDDKTVDFYDAMIEVALTLITQPYMMNTRNLLGHGHKEGLHEIC